MPAAGGPAGHSAPCRSVRLAAGDTLEPHLLISSTDMLQSSLPTTQHTHTLCCSPPLSPHHHSKLWSSPLTFHTVLNHHSNHKIDPFAKQLHQTATSLHRPANPRPPPPPRSRTASPSRTLGCISEISEERRNGCFIQQSTGLNAPVRHHSIWPSSPPSVSSVVPPAPSSDSTDPVAWRTFLVSCVWTEVTGGRCPFKKNHPDLSIIRHHRGNGQRAVCLEGGTPLKTTLPRAS